MFVRGAVSSAAPIRMRRKAAGSVKVVAAAGALATGELRVRPLSAKVPWRRRSARRPGYVVTVTCASADLPNLGDALIDMATSFQPSGGE